MNKSRTFPLIIIMGILLAGRLPAQSDPREILDKVQARYNAIEDYQVSVHLNVDIQNFRMPNKKMRVYFKRPDKVKIKTSGFAMVPRFGLIPTPAAFLNDSVGLELVRSFRENNILYHVVLVYQPKATKNNPDIFLRINTDRGTIDRVLMEYQEGKTEMDIIYQNVDGFWLPDTTKIIFDLKQAIPPVERPDIERPFGGMEDFAGRDSQPVKGEVTITFRNYAVNKGLKDAVFKEEEY